MDGGDGLVDQVGSVINRGYFDARGYLPPKLSNLRVHPFGHNATVFAGEHEGRAENSFLAVVRGRAGANVLPNFDLGQVSHP